MMITPRVGEGVWQKCRISPLVGGGWVHVWEWRADKPDERFAAPSRAKVSPTHRCDITFEELFGDEEVARWMREGP